MKDMVLCIPIDHRIGFWQTVNSHGWCTLPPFSVEKESQILARTDALRDGTLVHWVLSDQSHSIEVKIASEGRLKKTQQIEILGTIKSCLRLEEDFSEFYSEARRSAHTRWIVRAGAGRLLRAPTVFEDIVKMICTTNCSWALTESMVGNLTKELGKPFGDHRCTFPTPEAMAGVTENYLRKTIRAGYRSPYLLELATRIAEGRLDVERWRKSDLSTEELFEEVRSVKGIGPYAAGNLLKLLGRYDYLGLDSWVRAKYYALHKKGRRVSDKVIERHYAPLGKWRGLFFWLEMTRHWYEEKFPF